MSDDSDEADVGDDDVNMEGNGVGNAAIADDVAIAFEDEFDEGVFFRCWR